MKTDASPRSYDAIVELEQSGSGSSVKTYFGLLYDHCETPEEILAGALVNDRSYTPHNIAPTKNWSEFAAIRWPWGDARGLLRAGGRTYFEARLRLRDKLVESAREIIEEPKS